MNIKQAKARFTELTGLPAIQRYACTGVWDRNGHVSDWYKLANKKGLATRDDFDGRTSEYWISLVIYLETLEEAA